MPSQFQPFYPHPPQQAAPAKSSGSQQAAQGKSSPINQLLQAIGQQKQNAAAQQLMNDPDPDWLYTDATPAVVAASPASYY